MSPFAAAAKRAIDLAGAAAGLTLGAPLLLGIAAAIRLDSPGGALFRQERVGRDGRVFQVVKFRTMRPAPVEFNPDGSTRVAPGDARVTRVGRLLRGGLDELPNLINVLRGDMSLVGPRPDMPVHATQYTDEERRKLAVRPGMTSLAAVLGRNEIPWKRRIAIDLRWMDRWSLGLDLKIVAQTLFLPLGVHPFDFAPIVGDADG
jgi:lipopolysaccharide/colanic/teichoic acid biosynthesis glycosyltransferase